MKKGIFICFIVVFVLVVPVLGTISFGKLVNFYVNDVVDYNDWSVASGNKFETDTATSFFQKFNFVNLNGAVRKLLGQHSMNYVTRLNNGVLTETFGYVADEELRGIADSIISLKDYLQEKGIPFIYAVTPYSTSKFDPQIPLGVADYGNENLDRLRKMLEDGGVDLIDLRETMYAEGINQYDMFYRTDHHWNTRGGFYAYTKILDRLNGVMPCPVDPAVRDLSNYTITNYPEWHLGSRGQRTGIYFAGIDDYELITPNFGTSLTSGDETGTFESLIINMTPLQTRNPESKWTYDHVCGNAVTRPYINNNAWNDKKLLIMSDSFGVVVDPYFILSYREVRQMKEGLTTEYILDYQPDAVIMFYFIVNSLSAEICSFDLPTAG